MRIATAGLMHEANTFSAVPADLAQWHRAGVLEGPQIVQQYATAQATVSGFLAVGERYRDVEIVPLLSGKITPMGTITSEAFEHLVGRMLRLLEDQGPWDGVLLALHGAAVAEEYPDSDGEILRRVREVVGPHTPIGVTLDMHANISAQMVTHTDVMTVYQTNPHVDARAQALKAGELIRETIGDRVRPTTALEMIPVAINILRQGTDDAPMRDLLVAAREAERESGVLSISVVEGYPYADVPEMGMSIVVITDDDAAQAQRIAATLAQRTWDMREEFLGAAISVDEALRHADAAERFPVVLLDTGDNVGAGSPADSTHLLAAAQRLGVREVFASLCDPDSVQACVAAGPGAEVTLAVGGKTDGLHGEPVNVRGRVRVLTDGKWEDPGATHGGFRFFDTGTSALLRTDDGHDLLLTSRPQGTVSLQQLRAVGLEPTQQRTIIAKGVNSPRAAFEPIAAQMVYVATPGVTSADLSTFRYTRRRPMYPFEADLAWSPEQPAGA